MLTLKPFFQQSLVLGPFTHAVSPRACNVEGRANVVEARANRPVAKEEMVSMSKHAYDTEPDEAE